MTLTARRQSTFDALAAPLLADFRFLSINKGIVVNMNYIESIEKNTAVMENGKILPISRRKQSEVATALVQFRFENK